jgi:hypothetical protein
LRGVSPLDAFITTIILMHFSLIIKAVWVNKKKTQEIKELLQGMSVDKKGKKNCFIY